jgi:hypothetical protein
MKATPIELAGFAAQGLATMGVDPVWDKAVRQYVVATARARAEEAFGEHASSLAKHADRDLSLAKWRQSGWPPHVDQDLWIIDHHTQLQDAENRIRAEFYEPLWTAERLIAETPAPTLSAAIWKAAVMELADVQLDHEVSVDCAQPLYADFDRLASLRDDNPGADFLSLQEAFDAGKVPESAYLQADSKVDQWEPETPLDFTRKALCLFGDGGLPNRDVIDRLMADARRLVSAAVD